MQSSDDQSPTIEVRRSLLYPGDSEDATIQIQDDLVRPMDLGERYVAESLLGEGGMGVVHLCRDRQVGRRVAFKRMRSDDDDGHHRARFVREARVQGQLEHPAVVPVYDLGVTPDGASYFTMKRVRGVTLEQIVHALYRGDPELSQGYSRRRLLTAFNSVCLAVDFAHQRGVLHRDLKPANIMLGDYGEVYVLDWGLARVGGATDLETAEPVELDPTHHGHTVPGAVMGTPGYMAPEQMRGDADIGAAADVYALGAILFELLTFERLHPFTSLGELAASTLQGPEARPSVRAPNREVPPELEAVIVRAAALEPAKRFRSARELSQAIERFLDGERDLELRQDLSRSHAQAAALAARQAQSSDDSFDARRAAMREVGRALALDPDNPVAMETLVDLLRQPPSKLPDEVVVSLHLHDRQRLRWIGKVGAIAYASLLLYVPLFFWIGVRQWAWVLLFYGLALATSAVSLRAAVSKSPTDASVLLVMVLSNLTFASTATFFGPLVLTPTLLAVNAAGFTLYLAPQYRLLSMLTACVATMTPIALWAADLLPGGYVFDAGNIVIVPGALDLPALPSILMLTIAGIATVLTGALSVTQVRDALARSELQLSLYAWHLRELLPEAVRSPTDPTPGRSKKLAESLRPPA
jgi:eukaryotic-like serine/threonine-protein kinase